MLSEGRWAGVVTGFYKLEDTWERGNQLTVLGRRPPVWDLGRCGHTL